MCEVSHPRVVQTDLEIVLGNFNQAVLQRDGDKAGIRDVFTAEHHRGGVFIHIVDGHIRVGRVILDLDDLTLLFAHGSQRERRPRSRHRVGGRFDLVEMLGDKDIVGFDQEFRPGRILRHDLL